MPRQLRAGAAAPGLQAGCAGDEEEGSAEGPRPAHGEARTSPHRAEGRALLAGPRAQDLPSCVFIFFS